MLSLIITVFFGSSERVSLENILGVVGQWCMCLFNFTAGTRLFSKVVITIYADIN